MTNRRDIAILLATYNGEKFLREQFDSLLAQTYQNWTCYIHDDGSTDSTVKIIAEYSDNSDKFIALNYPPQGGGGKNFFSMVRKVDAPYIMFCDQDDVWIPEKIEKTLNKMRQTDRTDGPVCVFTDMKVVDANLNIIRESLYHDAEKQEFSFKSVFFCGGMLGCTMMINKILADYARKVEPCNTVLYHDSLCAYIALSEGVALFIPEPTILYRQHSGNLFGAVELPKLRFPNIPYRSVIRKVYHFIKYVVLKYPLKHFARYKGEADELLLCGVLHNQENIDFLKKVSYSAESDKFWLLNESIWKR
ncbi:hypothetical protein FACS1894187_16570 [Synergistales bacterium]|nr:hypothetical protein FACS1894187_16570 [Synergistales bacterium]